MKRKVILKSIQKHGKKIKNLIDLENNGLGEYDDKYKEIKFNSDDNLPLNKSEMHNVVVTIRAVQFFN